MRLRRTISPWYAKTISVMYNLDLHLTCKNKIKEVAVHASCFCILWVHFRVGQLVFQQVSLRLFSFKLHGRVLGLNVGVRICASSMPLSSPYHDIFKSPVFIIMAPTVCFQFAASLTGSGDFAERWLITPESRSYSY